MQSKQLVCVFAGTHVYVLECALYVSVCGGNSLCALTSAPAHNARLSVSVFSLQAKERSLWFDKDE